jgi:guanylate kinase
LETKVAKKGILFVISAPSGCGKTSVISGLLRSPAGLVRSVTYTTRPIREGERDGIDYHFVSPAEFERKKEEGLFLEWACVYGNLYGTGKSDVEDLLKAGKDVVLSVDVQGAKTIRSKMEAVMIFLLPPSREELARRLRGRGTETPEALKKRLEEAENELSHHELFDYSVTNDALEHCIQNLDSLIEIERKKRRF